MRNRIKPLRPFKRNGNRSRQKLNKNKMRQPPRSSNSGKGNKRTQKGQRKLRRKKQKRKPCTRSRTRPLKRSKRNGRKRSRKSVLKKVKRVKWRRKMTFSWCSRAAIISVVSQKRFLRPSLGHVIRILF